MVFVQTHAVDLSQPAITNVKKFVTEPSLAALATYPAKSAAAIQSAARNAMKPVHRVLSSVPGPVLTGSAVQCLAQYHAI